ncbi:hypothetical protein [Levilactobacillus brevis]|uniref:hypothetical protein n=1 Tax=Levilactobacillus brevis TaxID=1580 RepID=UPI0011192F0B|nr:hypothetical protein [Levilactobacillus brevis]QCZ47113.1 hypothetical protein UCCLB556_pA0003 [Levilactobacillus brevis]
MLLAASKATPKVVHLYQQYWWLDLRDILSAIAVIVTVGSLVIAVIVYRNSINSRLFDLTLKAIHLYNNDVRDGIKDFKKRFDEKISDNDYKKIKSDKNMDDEILKTFESYELKVAKESNIAGLIHTLDELGNYVKYDVINKEQLRLSIQSDLILLFKTDKYKFVFKTTIENSSIDSLKGLFKLIGVDIYAEH